MGRAAAAAGARRAAPGDSTYVVDELLTLVRMRGACGRGADRERLMQTRWCRIVEIGDDTREAAWQLFVRYHTTYSLHRLHIVRAHAP